MSRGRSLDLFYRLAAAALLLGLGGCDNMKKQENARTGDPSAHFSNGTSAQLPPPGTVAQGQANAYSAQAAAKLEAIAKSPVPVTVALLERGRERFDIYCAVCHGADGYGRGIVVRRGFPPPPSFHDDRLRSATVGHFFNVMTHGYGVMYAYGDRVPESDRWAIAAYIRALQRSQHGTLADVPPAERGKLDTP